MRVGKNPGTVPEFLPKRNYAFGELRWHVATCRQTVEALLAPLSTAWQRMATKSRSQPDARSHLSPDGGGFTHAPPPLGSGWLQVRMATGKKAKGKRVTSSDAA